MFYAWAEKNSRPQIPSNERKRNKFNGLLCVDAITGEEYLKLTESAKTEDIATYFVELCIDIVKQGFNKLIVILDNNSTHKQKMKNLLHSELLKLGINSILEIELIYLPPYSPNYNLVEYLIHQLRLKLLHHQPVGTTIELIRAKIAQYLQVNHLQTPEQIQNTIAHILTLVN